MKLRIASLSLLALCLAVVPAVAQNDLYDNGAINGTVLGWTINFGFAVSDQFTLGGDSPVNAIQFGAWLFPGDTLTSAEVSITSSEFGGTSFFDQTVNFTAGTCFSNGSFNVCAETGSFSGLVLNAGSYWLNLSNAVSAAGNPVYWDMNSGPSLASESSVGTIPSESFSILGSGSTTATTTTATTTGTTTPEPSSIMLFGSGILGLAGVLRRKLF
jgi:hypothetical protein